MYNYGMGFHLDYDNRTISQKIKFSNSHIIAGQNGVRRRGERGLRVKRVVFAVLVTLLVWVFVFVPVLQGGDIQRRDFKLSMTDETIDTGTSVENNRGVINLDNNKQNTEIPEATKTKEALSSAPQPQDTQDAREESVAGETKIDEEGDDQAVRVSPQVQITDSGVNGGLGWVVLDAGHGGSDPGTISDGIAEKNIDLEVVRLCADALDEAGVDYLFTRSDDTAIPIERRVNIANNVGAAFLVSVHCDWFHDENIKGISTLFKRGDETGERLAGVMQAHLPVGLETADRGAHPYDNIILLKNTTVPAILVELAFMSNNSDLTLLLDGDFREAAAQNVASGIVAALNDLKRLGE